MLYGIIDILLFKKKQLHCAFLDYEKAFDKIDRAIHWQKLFNLLWMPSLLPYDCMVKLIKFRTTNNKLLVNTLRYCDLPRMERFCDKCKLLKIGDEFHYLCVFFFKGMILAITVYFHSKPNAFKLQQLLYK